MMYNSKLKAIREEKGLSQSRLSEVSGVNKRIIQAYEQGYKDINKGQVLTVLALAEALEVDIRSILND